MVFGVALLAALLTGGYFLFRYIVSVFNTLEPQVETLAAIASVVALLCAVIIAEGVKSRGKNDSLAIAAAGKVKVYEGLLSVWSERLKSHGIGRVSEADAELVKLEQLLALYGSAQVITAYFTLRRSAKQEGELGDESPALLNKLLMEMREDLGCTAFNRKQGDPLDLLLGRN